VSSYYCSGVSNDGLMPVPCAVIADQAFCKCRRTIAQVFRMMA